jgi:hypothetical protein
MCNYFIQNTRIKKNFKNLQVIGKIPIEKRSKFNMMDKEIENFLQIFNLFSFCFVLIIIIDTVWRIV